MNEINEAMALIEAFWVLTHEEPDEEFDPEFVTLATREYNNGWTVVVYADLVNAQIIAWLDGNLVPLRTAKFKDLRSMIDSVLRNLDYEDLTHVSDLE